MGWYGVFMSRDTEALLDAFEHLPVKEKRAVYAARFTEQNVPEEKATTPEPTAPAEPQVITHPAAKSSLPTDQPR
jgi:hypothetical protein